MTTNSGFALVKSDNEKTPFKQRIDYIDKPMPELQSGEVLVKVMAAPVNPSDLVYLMGKYGVPPVEGAYAGFEACGIVEKANAGWFGRYLTGKRVAVFATPGKDGVWAKYAAVKATASMPVRKELSDAQASTLLVNPATSVCLVERAIQLGAKAVVLNAAASQVGKGVIRYAQQMGIKTIATVRSESNRAILQEMGATEVLLTTDEQYKEQLKQATQQYHATVLLDAVADSDTAILLNNMPARSTAIVYGRLADTHKRYGGTYGVSDVIFRDVKVEGFWLAHYIRRAGALKTWMLGRKVQRLFAEGVFDTDIYGQFNNLEFPEVIDHYAQHKSDGKVILLPHAV
jgi:NADPH:quinone reductase-like Zn-dependent oxidoreductase